MFEILIEEMTRNKENPVEEYAHVQKDQS